MNKFKNIFNKIIDILFPRRCMVCKNIFNYNSKEYGVCDRCLNIFKEVSGNTCIKCGRETTNEYCLVCSDLLNGKIIENNKFYFTKNYPIYKYDDASKLSIFDLKYNKKLSVLDGFERIIKLNIRKYNLSNIDIIIPVPIHVKKEKERGFNQAKLFSKIVSDITKIEYNDKILIRNKNTSVQSNKTLKLRYENLENCFNIVNKNLIANKVILLVDDIYTSGSTINTCAKELVENGAKEVFSLTISITGEKKDEIKEV